MSTVLQRPLLQVQNLSHQLGEHRVLERLSFSLEQGEFVGLLGPNGAGKSSLLRCIYRYYRTSAETIALNGECLQALPQRTLAQNVAVVLQQPESDMSLTVYEVVTLGLLPQGGMWRALTQEQKQRVHQALVDVGLCNLQHKPLAQLSGGEQQRAHIARALVQQPQLLIMDEPTSHLDIKYQIELMELVRSLKLTVLASFHDLNLACALCDRLLILKHGQLVADGTPKKVVTEQLLSDVFGVCAKVSGHPQQPDKWPLVQYFYGYQRHQHDG
ncbi:ABC transporter ATP-binding protein [Pseudoalteromonas ruthenica]|uniref:ABC transporter ATP-binding protein n=1 Tax=Pseudoalteromonas ruthenica TaxID=151081 RepID=UPI00211DC4AF|nr:ABC transporter ATP-binding protein [Pseudoalteromonas ruthenica]